MYFFISADQANSSVNIQYKITGFQQLLHGFALDKGSRAPRSELLGQIWISFTKDRVSALQQFALHYNVCQQTSVTWECGKQMQDPSCNKSIHKYEGLLLNICLQCSPNANPNNYTVTVADGGRCMSTFPRTLFPFQHIPAKCSVWPGQNKKKSSLGCKHAGNQSLSLAQAIHPSEVPYLINKSIWATVVISEGFVHHKEHYAGKECKSQAYEDGDLEKRDNVTVHMLKWHMSNLVIK